MTIDVPRGASTSPTTSCSIAIAGGQGRQGRAPVRRSHAGRTPRSRSARARSRSYLVDVGLTPEAARLHRALGRAAVRVEHLRHRSPQAACVTMGNPIAPIDDLRLRARLRARGRADHDAAGRRGARAVAAPSCRTSATILLVPDAATGEDPGSRRAAATQSSRTAAGTRRASTRCTRRSNAAASAPAAAAEHQARRSGDLAVHVGLDRPLEGRDAQPSRLRVQHRGLREAHRRLSRERRHASACRACSSATRPAPTCGSRSRSAPPSGCSASGRPRRASPRRSRATGRRSSRTCRRCSASCSISTTSAARKGEPGLDLSCVRFHLSAGEALPEPLMRRFVERFGGEVYDGIGSAEMFHIYCSNRPGDVMPGSLGRAVEGYELAILPEDADGAGAPPLPPGEIGVLWVKGDSRRARLLPGSRQELEDVPRPLVPHRRSVLDRRARLPVVPGPRR